MIRNSCIALIILALCPPLVAQTNPSPDLVVLIVVDQLRGDYLARYRPQFTAGFKRLLDQGAVFTNAYHDHAVTETAVGHATALSGRFPRSHGVISNRRGVPDPTSPSISSGPGASPFRFRGTTLIDWLRIRDPESRALSVSMKDRGAILPLGRAKQHVFWWVDAGTRNHVRTDSMFTTSVYYADTLPTWVRSFNAGIQRFLTPQWTLLLDPGSYPERDSVAAENRGASFVFPHWNLPFRYYPRTDEMLAALALAGIDTLRLGKTGHVDVLAVSFSATDQIGHKFGPDSRELHDQLLRLDRTLGAFLDSLYARFRPEQIVLALTSDHGVTPFPQVDTNTEAAAKARSVDTVPATAAARALLKPRGIADTAVAIESGMLVLKPVMLRHDRALMDSLAATFVRSARALPGVLRVDYVRDLAKRDTIRDAITRRWLHTIPPDLPIPVVMTLKPKHIYGQPTTAHHGSPHDLDAWVPIIFYGPQFKAGEYSVYVRTVDIAPTLAHVLRVQPAERLDGKTLTQALR